MIAGACTSILDFDGYEYVETGAASSGAATGSTSVSTSGNAGATNSSASGGGTSTGGMAGSGGAAGSGGPECTSYLDCTLNQWCDVDMCVPDKLIGEPCREDEQCPDDDCKHGVCCESECEGDCERCDLQGSEGTCTQLPTGSQGDCMQPLTCNSMGMCQ
jgi:hypothetical protein